MGILCMAHKTNFAIQTLSHFSMATIIFIYFRPSTKKNNPKALKGIKNLQSL
jgi:accessory colonization factor AcfC